MAGFDGQGFSFEHEKHSGGIEKRIKDLIARIRALRMRNPGWDTSDLSRKLDALRQEQRTH